MKKRCDRRRPCQRCEDAGIGFGGCAPEEEAMDGRCEPGNSIGVDASKTREPLSDITSTVVSPSAINSAKRCDEQGDHVTNAAGDDENGHGESDKENIPGHSKTFSKRKIKTPKTPINVSRKRSHSGLPKQLFPGPEDKSLNNQTPNARTDTEIGNAVQGDPRKRS